MLNTASITAVLPTTDLERAKSFYGKTLGLKAITPAMPGGAVFEAGAGTRLFVYQRPPVKVEHTQAGFLVKDIDATMKELRSHGVKFEEYDLPGLKTVNGVVSDGKMRSAWFKDPDGNILALNQM